MHDNTGASLVGASSNGEPITTSLIIAEGVGLQHKNVLETIRKNLPDFEEFGVVAFQTRVAGQSPNPTKFAVLNREHAMLLLTYMRNNDVVRQFKKSLIRAFTEMERRLATKPNIDGNSITRMELIQIALNAETERLALEAKNKELDRICDYGSVEEEEAFTGLCGCSIGL